MKLIDGRLFDERDGTDTQPVALINQTMARNYWPGENPIGKRFYKGDDPNRRDYSRRNCRRRSPSRARSAGAARDVYVSTSNSHRSKRTCSVLNILTVRTAGDPMQMAETIRQQVWAVDKEQAVANVMPLEDFVDEKLAPREMQTSLLGGFAGLACCSRRWGFMRCYLSR